MVKALPVLALSLVLAACASLAAAPDTHPSTTASATPSASPLPATVWVNVPLGANLRGAPDLNAARLDTLPHGARADVVGQRDMAAGSSWYQVKSGHVHQGWGRAPKLGTSAVFLPSGSTDG